VVRFKPGAVSGSRALAVPYVTARDVMDRLDRVLGPAGWTVRYSPLEGGNVVCTLAVRLAGEWVEKSDVGGPSGQPDEGDRVKAAFSDALKRAAVAWGVGRYLYRLPQQWCDYDPRKRQWVRPPSLPQAAPRAGASAGKTPPRVGQAPTPRSALPADGPELERRVQALDRQLSAAGLCREGELIAYLVAGGEERGYPSLLARWGKEAIEDAAGWTRTFKTLKLRVAVEDARQAANRPWVDVTRTLNVPGNTRLEQLNVSQLEDALAWLRRKEAPGATPAA
jgi:hypothetical protein